MDTLSKWGQQTNGTNSSVYQFTSDTYGKDRMWYPILNKTQLHTVFSCCILLLLSLCWWRLTDITNTWTHLMMDLLHYLTLLKLKHLFLVIVQMGHDICNSLADCWLATEQFLTPFYGKIMKHDRFFHIIQFLNFSNNCYWQKWPNCDRLWKVRNVFDLLNNAYSKYDAPYEHLAVNKVIILYKGRVLLKQYIPKKHKHFGNKTYKLCDIWHGNLFRKGQDTSNHRCDMDISCM
jgi:hypothetical protein